MLQFIQPGILMLLTVKLNNTPHYFRNESSLKNAITLSSTFQIAHVRQYLFEVVFPSSNKKSTPCEYYQPLLIRHKFTQKYLSQLTSPDPNGGTNSRVVLSQQKSGWKLHPSYKYQLKHNIYGRLGERVFLSQENNSNWCITIDRGSAGYQLRVQFEGKSELTFLLYAEDGKSFVYGQHFRVFHQESAAYLVDGGTNKEEGSKKKGKNQDIVGFEKQTGSGNGLMTDIWFLEALDFVWDEQHFDGTIKLNAPLCFKSLLSHKSLVLLGNDRQNRYFRISSQQKYAEMAQFILQPVTSIKHVMTSNTQVRIKHAKIDEYLAVSKQRAIHGLIQAESEEMPLDQNFYELKALTEQEELAVTFVKSFRAELTTIFEHLTQSNPSIDYLNSLEKLYCCIEADLSLLLVDRWLMFILRQQLKSFIPLIVSHIVLLKQHISKQSHNEVFYSQLVRHNYHLLCQMCKGSIDNKLEAFRFVNVFITDAFKDVEVEELMQEMFRDNMKLLAQLAQKREDLGTSIIESLLSQINTKQKASFNYWPKIRKIISLLRTFIVNEGQLLDINQRTVALLLFSSATLFNVLFFRLQIKKSLIYIRHPVSQQEVLLTSVKEPFIRQVADDLFHLLAELCQNRNLVSKQLIDRYLFGSNGRNKDIRALQYIKTLPSPLKNKMELLIANIYVDSYPRISSHRPMAIIKMSIQEKEGSEMQQQIAEMAELTSRLTQSMIYKAEKAYQSRPLAAFGQNMQEPTLGQEQLEEFKSVILSSLENYHWQHEDLKILSMMLKLGLFTFDQIKQIETAIFRCIEVHEEDANLMPEIIEILQEIFDQFHDLHLSQTNLYLLHLVETQKQQNLNLDYLLPLSKDIFINPLDNFAVSYRKAKYNSLNKHQSLFYNRPTYRQLLLETLAAQCEIYPLSLSLSMFHMVEKISRPIDGHLQLMKKCSILGQGQLAKYEVLSEHCLQIKRFSEVSEEWLCNQDPQPQDLKKFLRIISLLIGYLYGGDLQFEVQKTVKRSLSSLNINRQLLLHNIGLHYSILELLQTNYYLLIGTSRRSISKKVRAAFEACFDFFYHFCLDCKSNKQAVLSEKQTLSKFKQCLQAGQTKLFIMLLKNQKERVREIQTQDLEELLQKILKESQANCEFDPIYVEHLLAMVLINDKPYLPNILKMVHILQDSSILKKLLFIVISRNQLRLCLQFHKIKLDPVQVPILYHAKILKLLTSILSSLGNKAAKLRKILKQFISPNYLFTLLALDDIYSHQGLPAEMKFILKISAFKLMHIYIDYGEVESETLDEDGIGEFLQQCRRTWLVGGERREIVEDNQMVYLPYLEEYQEMLQLYGKSSSLFFDETIKPLLIKLREVMEKYMNQSREQNYEMLIDLLDIAKKIKGQTTEKRSSLTFKTKQVGRWPNFAPFSSTPSYFELKSKRILFNMFQDPLLGKLHQQQMSKFNDQLLKQSKSVRSIAISVLKKSLHQFQTCNQMQISHFLQTLFHFLKHCHSQTLGFQQQWQELIIPLLKLLQSEGFDYNLTKCRKIFNSTLQIINLILSVKIDKDILEQILSYLKENNRVILDHVRHAILEITEEQWSSSIQKVQYAQAKLSLKDQFTSPNNYDVALTFIRLLCQYSPFTIYLRSQQNAYSIDFVELIFGNLSDLVSKAERSVSIASSYKIELLVDTLMATFNGINRKNQLVVGNKKFVEMLVFILKLDNLQKMKQDVEVEMIVEEMAKIYGQTIPILQVQINKELQFLVFRDGAVLKSIKLSILKLILAAVTLNNEVLRKIKVHLPSSLLKLIIVDSYTLLDGIDLADPHVSQLLLLQSKHNWRVTDPNREKRLSTVLGLLAYQLLQMMSEKDNKTSTQDEKQDIVDEQRTLSVESRTILRALRSETIYKDILSFFQEYEKAMSMFKSCTFQLQISYQGQLACIYCVKLGMCSKITKEMVEEFNQSCSRITREEKLKSLMQFEQQTYLALQMEIQYDDSLRKYIGPFVPIIIFLEERRNEFFLVYWLLHLIISIHYLVINFANPPVSPDVKLSNEFLLYFGVNSNVQSSLLVFSLLNMLLGVIALFNLLVKKLPFSYLLNNHIYDKFSDKDTKDNPYKTIYLFTALAKEMLADLSGIVLSILSLFHPFFSCFFLIYILSRLEMGRTVIKAISLTWFSLLATVGILVIFDFLFSITTHIFLSSGTSYSESCKTLFTCLKLILDYDLKGGFPLYVPTNLVNISLDLDYFSQIIYVIFGTSVLTQIFGGTIIDKFSQLREKVDSIELDEKTICFICGQLQFEIDFDLEGFKQHTEATHNRMSYIWYLFYIRRKQPEKDSFIEQFVRECLQKKSTMWIPDETSILRREKDAEKEDQKEDNLVELVRDNMRIKSEEMRKISYRMIRVKKELMEMSKNRSETPQIYGNLYSSISSAFP